MTIAVAIRTGSAVVFAADSKLTTLGLTGFEEDGTPRWEDQTYDNATKVVYDRTRNLMAMVAGHANIGRVTATDFISTRSMRFAGNVEDQNRMIADLVTTMVDLKRAYWATTEVKPENWPGPTVLLAAPSPAGDVPRVWRVRLDGPESEVTEILTEPWIKLEGSYDEIFSLLYGYEHNLLMGIREQLGIEAERLKEAINTTGVLRPIDKLNLWSMPIQDAIDMAVFLAKVQVEMDRFLPGAPVCGGPIDVMVLQMAPEPGIVAYPGKVLHHP
jgi:hypothetical protein